jgi:hypothetical protein
MTSYQAKSYSRSHDAVIRVYDDAGNVIETQPQLRLCRVLSFPFELKQAEPTEGSTNSPFNA